MANVTGFLNRLHLQQAANAAPTSQSTPRRTSTAIPAFRSLLTGSAPAATPAAAAAPAAGSPLLVSAAPVSTAPPTPESVFGANPWVTNPVGHNPNGSMFSYNPIYFATASTASQVAQMLGGTVIQSNALAPNAQQQPNLMVQMPDGRTINAGLVASFYSHGYPQSYIDGMIARQINGTAA